MYRSSCSLTYTQNGLHNGNINVRGQLIDAVLVRVDSMVALLEGMDFAPLERANAGRWAAVRSQFNSTNEEVKVATRELINTCFRCFMLLGQQSSMRKISKPVTLSTLPASCALD